MKYPKESEGDTNLTEAAKRWRSRSFNAEAEALLRRDANAFLHQSVSTPCLNAIKKAEGIYIETLDGKRYMDFHGNNVHHVGYGHPRVIEAITAQLNQLSFAPRRYTCEPAVSLAERLDELSPGGDNKVLFSTGGSDAVEIALKIARFATGRFKTLSFWDSFHGAGFGASSVGGEQMFRSGPIGPLMAGAEHVPPFGDYRNAWGLKAGSAEVCARQIRYVLEKEGDVAALIAEPTRAVPYVPPSGFWQEVRKACSDNGALLIFDEIPTGLGKTGKLFASEYEEVVPDITVLGKSLGGGILPIAATIADSSLDVCGEYAIGHYTHEKNPVTASAALATLDVIEDEGLVENAYSLGVYALERLWDMAERYPAIGDVRGRGLLFGIEMVVDRETREPDNALADQVLYACLERGLNFKTTMGNVLTFTPPLVLSRAQLDEALRIVDDALQAVCRP